MASSAEIYYLPSGCNCDNKTSYTQTQIEQACQEALTLASEGKQEGRDEYPHAYNDYEKFNFSHAKKPYLEFPVLSNGEYEGGSPGADRVVIGSIAEDYSSAVYCAVITHDGSAKNGFTECQDDSMNVNGKGKYEPQEGDRERKRGHGHGGRKLRSRIDFK
ncbi:Ribonuclease/ribotoxin [Delphinella strobiligena]|nr:Ribonuclease/ribotoxin [Delphinella strobiligena]